MKPYYDDGDVTLYLGDCREIMPSLSGVVVSDPPYNIGYKYDTHADKMPGAEYLEMLSTVLRQPSVVLHYPEDMFAVARAIGVDPCECVAWVYNTNLPKRWRMWSWFGVMPEWANLPGEFITSPKDKRIAALMERGRVPRHADWIFQSPCKNVSAEKVDHPAQLPQSLMDKILTITPADTVIDPFCGSGTTLVSAKARGIRAIGIDVSERYLDMAAQRCAQGVLL